MKQAFSPVSRFLTSLLNKLVAVPCSLNQYEQFVLTHLHTKEGFKKIYEFLKAAQQEGIIPQSPDNESEWELSDKDFATKSQFVVINSESFIKLKDSTQKQTTFNEQIEKLRTEKSSLQFELQNLLIELKSFRDKKELFDKVISDYSSQIDKLNNEKLTSENEFQKKIAEFENGLKKTQQFAKLALSRSSEIAKLNQQYILLKMENNQLQIRLNQVKSERDNFEKLSQEKDQSSSARSQSFFVPKKTHHLKSHRSEYTDGKDSIISRSVPPDGEEIKSHKIFQSQGSSSLRAVSPSSFSPPIKEFKSNKRRESKEEMQLENELLQEQVAQLRNEVKQLAENNEILSQTSTLTSSDTFDFKKIEDIYKERNESLQRQVDQLSQDIQKRNETSNTPANSPQVSSILAKPQPDPTNKDDLQKKTRECDDLKKQVLQLKQENSKLSEGNKTSTGNQSDLKKIQGEMQSVSKERDDFQKQILQLNLEIKKLTETNKALALSPSPTLETQKEIQKLQSEMQNVCSERDKLQREITQLKQNTAQGEPTPSPLNSVEQKSNISCSGSLDQSASITLIMKKVWSNFFFQPTLHKFSVQSQNFEMKCEKNVVHITIVSPIVHPFYSVRCLRVQSEKVLQEDVTAVYYSQFVNDFVYIFSGIEPKDFEGGQLFFYLAPLKQAN